ncbi:RNA polymerase sigma factor [candidate division KSB1 bacterium]|nr:RNA polymerase sigma factor [candidate division KSB1 bacterium]
MVETDAQLIVQSGQGDSRAFGELYKRYQNAVYRYLLCASGDPSWAEDMFQEVWLRVADHLRAKKTIQDFKKWLFTVAANYFRDELRKKYIRRFFMPEYPGMSPEKESVCVPAVAESGHMLDKAYELRQDLSAALQKLTARQRTIFLLAAYEGFKMAEIARMLNLAEGTVKATLHKTVVKLRKELENSLD